MRCYPAQLFALVLSILCLRPIVIAEIIATNWDDPNTYGYINLYMPDFDQKRQGDLLNDGNCYCWLASESDLLAYIATHGFPEYAPGQENWQLQANYDLATALLEDIRDDLGFFADGTGDDGCGTYQSEIYDNLKMRICDKFCVKSEKRSYSSGHEVKFSHMAQDGEDGAIIAMGYGRYDWTNDEGVRQLDDRTGGHAVVITQIGSAGTYHSIAIRDPADDGVNTTQSDFSNRFYDFHIRTVKDNYSSSSPNDPMLQEEIFEDTAADDSSKIKLLDGYIAVTPRSAYTWDDFDDGVAQFIPGAPVWFGGPPERTFQFEVADDDQVIAVIPGMWGRTIYWLTESGQIRCLRRADLSMIQIAIPKLKAPVRAFQIDPYDRIGVLAGGNLLLYGINHLQEPLHVIDLGFEGTALVLPSFMPNLLVGDSMPPAIVLGGNSKKLAIVRFPVKGQPIVDVFQMPDPIQSNNSTRLVHGGYPPSLFMITNGHLDRVQITAAGVEQLPMQVPNVGAEITDFDVDDLGRLVVAAGGAMHAFKQGSNYTWVHDSEHIFDGQPAKSRLFLPRSNSNWLPGMDEDPPNQEPDPNDDGGNSQRDCDGDFNVDRVVDGADLGIMLADWGLARSVADINRDGLVDGADLGVLLANWGPCIN